MARRDVARIERAAMNVAAARDELIRAMLVARASGETYATIGTAAGMTPQRVHQLVKERETQGP